MINDYSVSTTSMGLIGASRRYTLVIVVIVVVILLVDGVLSKGASGGNKGVQKPGGNNNNQAKGKTPGAKQPKGSQTASETSEAETHADGDNKNTCPKCRKETHEELLLKYLFRDYNSIARAVMDIGRTVVVSIDFVLLRIHGLDERSQVLTTTGLVIAEWTDERLTWEPEQFGNLTDMIITADKLWLPELAVMNGAEELMPDFDRIRVLLHFNGRIHWEPGGIFKTTCDIDIAYFPFDSQNCPLFIGSYSYYSHRVNITNASNIISTHDFRVNGEWHVYGTTAEWGITYLDTTGQRGYAHVIFRLLLKRRYKFYIMNIVLPCVMLSVLIMIGFCLPPEAGEKISLGISVLLAFTVFLLMIAESIPKTSSAIPLIVTYLMATMTLGTVSICMTVVILNVHHRGPRHRMPRWLRAFSFLYLARLLCVRTTSRTFGRIGGASIRKMFPMKTTRGGNGIDSQRGGRPGAKTQMSPPTDVVIGLAVGRTPAKSDADDREDHLLEGQEIPIWKRRRVSPQPFQESTAGDTTIVQSQPKSRQNWCSRTIPEQSSNQRRSNGNATTTISMNDGCSKSSELPRGDDRLPPSTVPIGASDDVTAIDSNVADTDNLEVVACLRPRYRLPTSVSPIEASGRICPCRPLARVRQAVDADGYDDTVGGSGEQILDRLRSATRRLLLATSLRRTSALDSSSVKAKKYAEAASALTSSFEEYRPYSSSSSVSNHVDCHTRRNFTASSTSPHRRRSKSVIATHSRYENDSSDEDCNDDVVINEWRELARVLDRLCFWLLFALMTVSSIVILFYPKYTGNETGW